MEALACWPFHPKPSLPIHDHRLTSVAAIGESCVVAPGTRLRPVPATRQITLCPPGHPAQHTPWKLA